MFLEETSVRFGRLSKDHYQPCGWASSNSSRAPKEQKGKGRINSLSLSWKVHIVLPLDSGAPGSWAFKLALNFATSFPGSPACRWQIKVFLGLYNPVDQFLLCTFVYKILLLILWATLADT
uniref:Uncharacterized protein n=1 Tax=Rousettus aegyptiacus TaxID=9407 RepID=A0A7J8JHB2_ROUAE|nr:hypothetical protein HJG63_010320 [Rousettus aegyptiacus]